MSKLFEFALETKDLDTFFSPIRTKIDLIKVLMSSMRFMLIDHYVHKTDIRGKLILKVDKKSRLFYISENKYYTITFPFKVLYDDTDDKIFFSSGYIDNIDSQILSSIVSILTCDPQNNSQCIYDFVDPILDDPNQNIWSIIKELLFSEDGYLRYDHDPAHEDGLIHPLHHYDIFYSSKSTFKLGLRDSIESITLLDMLDSTTDCHYLT